MNIFISGLHIRPRAVPIIVIVVRRSTSLFEGAVVVVIIGQGYAQVVLTFQGQLGTNYTATSSHLAVSNITDLPEGGGPTY